MINRILSLPREPQDGAATSSDDAQSSIRDRLGNLPLNKETLKKIEDIIREHPGVSLGVALSAGVFIGWLMKRK